MLIFGFIQSIYHSNLTATWLLVRFLGQIEVLAKSMYVVRQGAVTWSFARPLYFKVVIQILSVCAYLAETMGINSPM